MKFNFFTKIIISALIIGCIGFSVLGCGSSHVEEPLANLARYFETADKEYMEKALCEADYEIWDEEYSQQMEKVIEEALDKGEVDISYKYDVKKMSSSEIAEINDTTKGSLAFYDVEMDFTINGGYICTVDAEISKGEDISEQTLEVKIIKINGKWYVSDCVPMYRAFTAE